MIRCICNADKRPFGHPSFGRYPWLALYSSVPLILSSLYTGSILSLILWPCFALLYFDINSKLCWSYALIKVARIVQKFPYAIYADYSNIHILPHLLCPSHTFMHIFFSCFLLSAWVFTSKQRRAFCNSGTTLKIRKLALTRYCETFYIIYSDFASYLSNVLYSRCIQLSWFQPPFIWGTSSINIPLFSVTLTLLKSTGQLFLRTICQLRSVFLSLLIRVGLSTFSQNAM